MMKGPSLIGMYLRNRHRCFQRTHAEGSVYVALYQTRTLTQVYARRVWH